MLKFVGEYTAKVDDKGRVVFPAALKSQMLEYQRLEGVESHGSDEKCGSGRIIDRRFVIKKDLWENCLQMFSYVEWEKESEGLKSKINFLNRDQAAFWREYTRGRAIVEPDEKLGRITIPATLLESIGAGRELVFCGSDHKIEIWGKEQFEKSFLAAEKFVSLAEKLSEK